MNRICQLTFFGILFSQLCHSQTNVSIYHNGWIDFNKNGKMDVFENPKENIENRIADLLSQMTIDEKTNQCATLYGYRRVLEDPLPTPNWKNEIWRMVSPT